MKKSQKPRTPKQRLEFVAITILVVMVYAVLIPIAFIPAMIYMWRVVVPIMLAVETQSNYLTWHEVKRRSGKRTSSVLSVLANEAMPGGQYDCMLRDQVEVERYERKLGLKCSSKGYPLSVDEAVFYRFRPKGGTPKRRKLLPYILPVFGWLPQPVRA